MSLQFRNGVEQSLLLSLDVTRELHTVSAARQSVGATAGRSDQLSPIRALCYLTAYGLKRGDLP